MTLDEMIDVVLSDLGEDPASPIQYTRAEAATAINNGYDSMTEATEWFEITIPIPIGSRRTYFDLRNFGQTILMVTNVHNSVTDRWLLPRGVQDHDDAYRFWEFQFGSPEDFFIRGLNWFGIWPRQEGGVGYFRLSCVAMAPRLVRPVDVPGFLEEYQQGLIEYGKYELKALDHQNRVALQFFANYLEHEQKLADWVQTRRQLDKFNTLGNW